MTKGNTMTRRVAMTTGTALVAVGATTPARANHAIDPAYEAREFLRLWNLRCEAEQESNKAQTIAEELAKEAEAQEPEWPEGLTCRNVATDERRRMTEQDIENWVRAITGIWPDHKIEQWVRTKRALLAQWEADDEAVRERIGYLEAERAEKETFKRFNDLEMEMEAKPAHTVIGLAVKLHLWRIAQVSNIDEDPDCLGFGDRAVYFAYLDIMRLVRQMHGNVLADLDQKGGAA